MKYKIIVDKQSRLNPSTEKKEYEIDIEELRAKGDVYDSLVITKEEDYVMRRLSLSEFHVLSVLEEPIKEPLKDINIELFEGDNYIYLVDMSGNKFYAEYLIKNEFNDLYVIHSEMNSAIQQSAKEVEIGVNQKLTNYSTTEEMNAAIKVLADAIALEVAKKVNDKDLTSANIILRINEDDSSEAQINADKININGTISANGNFKVDKKGNLECNNGKFNDGEVICKDDGFSAYEGKIRVEGGTFIYGLYSEGLLIRKVGASTNSISNPCIFLHMYDGEPHLELLSSTGMGNFNVTPGQFYFQTEDGKVFSIHNNQMDIMDIPNIYARNSAIHCLSLDQISLENQKKNFEKLDNDTALQIILNTDIYKYNLKNQADSDKKHIGFVIGDKYKYAEEITSENNDGVDNYSMTSASYGAIQKLYSIIQELQAEIKELKGENNG